MKIKGLAITPPEPVIVAIPRQSGDIIFKAQPVLDYSEFEALCPEPQPPEVLKPGNIRFKNTKDKRYLEAVNAWSTKKANWMMLKSLEATEGIEWEQVNPADSDTWYLMQKELQDSGFSVLEISALLTAITEACGLNQDKIDKATKSFLATRDAVPEEGSYPDSEQSDTQSGERVSE